MFTPQLAQWLVFLQSILLGVALGLYYDVLRALRRHFRLGVVGTALLDTLFWVGLLVALFEFGLNFAAGQSRGYVLVGMGLGGALYFALPGPLVIALLCDVLDGLRRARLAVRRCADAVRLRLQPVDIHKKITQNVKKFIKSSSIFGGKGIK